MVPKYFGTPLIKRTHVPSLEPRFCDCLINRIWWKYGKRCGVNIWAQTLRYWQLLPCISLDVHAYNLDTMLWGSPSSPVKKFTKRGIRVSNYLPASEPESWNLVFQPQSSQPSWHHMEQGQAVPAKPHPSCRFVSKINAYYYHFKLLLSFGIDNYIAIENSNRWLLFFWLSFLEGLGVIY